MKLPLRVTGTVVLKLIDYGFQAAIFISDLFSGKGSKKKRFEDLVEKQAYEREQAATRRAPTVVLKRPPPTTPRD